MVWLRWLQWRMKLTPDCSAGSSWSAQAFMLQCPLTRISISLFFSILDWRHVTYTKGSLTATTKTWPADLRLGWLMYDGMCVAEQVPEKAAGTPTM